MQLDIIEGCGRCASAAICSSAYETSPSTSGMMRVINLTRFSEATSPTISSRCPPLARVWRRFAFRTRIGAYRVVYVARRAEAVYVLHAFQKKTKATPRNDLQIA